MPSTRQLPSLTLAYRRADTIALWAVITVVLAAALGMAAALLRLPAPWAWSAAAFGVLLPGLVWQPWFELGVRAWNRGSRLMVVALRGYVLAVCYYLIFGAVGRAGMSAEFVGHARKASGWTARQPRAGQDDSVGPATAPARWRDGLVAAASGRGHAWVVCLLPVLALLMLLGDDRPETAPSSSTYTLY